MWMKADKSILDVMNEYVQQNREDWGHGFFNSKTDSFDLVSNAILVETAFSFGYVLVQNGVKEKDLCMIVCNTPLQQIISFYACLSIRAIPLIIPNPKALAGEQDLLLRISKWKNSFHGEDTFIISDESISGVISHLNQKHNLIMIPKHPLDELPGCKKPVYSHVIDGNDVAYYQMTSASTGEGKAVAITHNNIIANVSAIKEAVQAGENEVVCSWLPLNHDMGLVGTELFSFYHRYPLLTMSPFDFIKRPKRWLDTISRYQCTLSPSPNFGYDYCTKMIDTDKLEMNLDLSSWKGALNGAEPIRLETVVGFYDKFKKYGLKKESILPVYGLAEATLAATFTNPTEPSSYLVLDKHSIGLQQKVTILHQGTLGNGQVISLKKEEEIIAFSVGKAIAGMNVSIVSESDEDQVLDELECGEIFLQGSSVAWGYIYPEENRIDPFEGVLRTGDLGFIYKDELYVIERLKNVIIRNGENYFSNILEESLADLLKIGEERIVVIEEDILNPKSDIVAVIGVDRRDHLDQLTSKLLDIKKGQLPITKFVFIKKSQIPRTTSGKKRHFMCRKLINNQAFEMIQVVKI